MCVGVWVCGGRGRAGGEGEFFFSFALESVLSPCQSFCELLKTVKEHSVGVNGE